MTFLFDYFIEPWLHNGFFNTVNTVTYGILLIIGFVLVFRLLKRLRVTIDWRLMVAVLPFVFFASATRALRDFIYRGIDPGAYPGFFTDLGYNYSVVASEAFASLVKVLPSPLAWMEGWLVAVFPTPGGYFVTAALALASLFIGIGVQRKWRLPYWKTMAVIGLVLAGWSAVLLPIEASGPLLIVAAILAGWLALFFGIAGTVHTGWFRQKSGPVAQKLRKLFTYENTGILGAHLLDATATFTALTYFGFVEQHVLPRFLIGLIGPVAMFPLKIAVILPVLYIIDGYEGDPDFKNFIKLAVLILGTAPGLRDVLTLLV